uniref:Tetraspanin-31-like n=1 Tax=Sinocyclocheilus rhinocerous TaxID=307959 RepID=A0A673FSB7_9TELE
MVILFIVFLFQFGVSCSCLAMNQGSSWGLMSKDTRISLEKKLDCCGLFNNTQNQGVFMSDLHFCDAPCVKKSPCLTCGEKMLQHSSEALKILGGVGLFFSFTEVSSGGN